MGLVWSRLLSASASASDVVDSTSPAKLVGDEAFAIFGNALALDGDVLVVMSSAERKQRASLMLSSSFSLVVSRLFTQFFGLLTNCDRVRLTGEQSVRDERDARGIAGGVGVGV